MNVTEHQKMANVDETSTSNRIIAENYATSQISDDDEEAGKPKKSPPAATNEKKMKTRLSYAESIPCQPRRERLSVATSNKKEGKSLAYSPIISPDESRRHRRSKAKPLMTEKKSSLEKEKKDIINNDNREEINSNVGAFRCGKNLDDHQNYTSNSDIEQGLETLEEGKENAAIVMEEGKQQLQPIVAVLVEEADSKLRKLEEENKKLKLREQNTPFAQAELVSFPKNSISSNSSSFFKRYKKIVMLTLIVVIAIIVSVIILSSNENKQSSAPSSAPSSIPSSMPSLAHSLIPTTVPSPVPSSIPSSVPSFGPSLEPSSVPTLMPSSTPSSIPSLVPSSSPSQTPSIETTQQIEDYKFEVESVEDDGRYFKMSADNFPIPISSFENTRMKTTIRLLNTRTNVTKGAIIELFPETNLIQGYYNPREYTKAGDFMVGDELEAIDYKSLSANKKEKEGSCIQHEFSIIDVSWDIAWNVPASNIRIGKFGVIGSYYKAFEYMVHLETPVTALWTDAVDVEIEYSTGSWYSNLTPSADDPTVRNFNTAISGDIRILFKNANLDTLNGLVTQRDAGGLHMAFCT